jgi:hypothetical protein
MPVTRGQYFTSLPASSITGLTNNRLAVVSGGVLTTTPNLELVGAALVATLDSFFVDCPGDSYLLLDDGSARLGIDGGALLHTDNTTMTLESVTDGPSIIIDESIGVKAQSAPGAANLRVVSNRVTMDTANGTSFEVDDDHGAAVGSFNFPFLSVDELSINSSGKFVSNGVIESKQDGDIASAASGLLDPQFGNSFVITGTNNISYISIIDPFSASYPDGFEITLFFSGVLTINNNGGAAPANYLPILLDAGVSLSTALKNSIRLQLSSKGGVRAWRQVGAAALVA